MDLHAVEAACKAAQEAARQRPGRYGGRYVARDNDGIVEVLTHDDPDRLDRDHWDVIAHCTPEAVYPVGRARYWLNDDGTINEAALD